MSDVGHAASGFIDALKGQPLVLALCVMNLLLVGYLYYEGVSAHTDRRHEIDLLYDNRKFVGELLARCTLQPSEKK